MKRVIAALVIILIFCAPFAAMAQENSGIWEKRFYVNEFELPIDQWYITTKEWITGKFSNSATTDSPLNVNFIIDGEYVALSLYEYGNHRVNNTYSTATLYNISIMDSTGEIYYTMGRMIGGGGDKISFDSSKEFFQAVFKGGPVSFSIVESERSRTKYLFTVPDASGLDTIMSANQYFTTVGEFNDGLAWIESYGMYGYIDTTGEVVIPCEYDFAFSFCNGLAVVEKDNKNGVIDTIGNVIVPFKYDRIQNEIWNGADAFNEGFAAACTKEMNREKWGYINTSGEVAIPLQYGYVGPFSEGYASVYDGNLVDDDLNTKGYINANGELVIPCEAEFANTFCEGMAAIRRDRKWGFIDTTGNIVISCEYESAETFNEGLACVEQGDQYGYIDAEGNLVIPFEYDRATDFSEGMACVSQDGKYGYIDKNGSVCIPFQADYGYQFRDGFAKITLDEKYGYIDTVGNVVIPCEYGDRCVGYGDGYFTLIKENQLVILDKDLNQIN